METKQLLYLAVGLLCSPAVQAQNVNENFSLAQFLLPSRVSPGIV